VTPANQKIADGTHHGRRANTDSSHFVGSNVVLCGPGSGTKGGYEKD
jgi:hypothetical protein